MSEHLQTSELTESRVNVKLFFRTILANPGRAVVRYPPPAPGYLSARAIRNLTTGLSLIGRWTMAANTPKPTPAHHIAS